MERVEGLENQITKHSRAEDVNSSEMISRYLSNFHVVRRSNVSSFIHAPGISARSAESGSNDLNKRLMITTLAPIRIRYLAYEAAFSKWYLNEENTSPSNKFLSVREIQERR